MRGHAGKALTLEPTQPFSGKDDDGICAFDRAVTARTGNYNVVGMFKSLMLCINHLQQDLR